MDYKLLHHDTEFPSLPPPPPSHLPLPRRPPGTRLGFYIMRLYVSDPISYSEPEGSTQRILFSACCK